MLGSLEDWKKDWKENQDEFESDQSELFKRIRDRKN